MIFSRRCKPLVPQSTITERNFFLGGCVTAIRPPDIYGVAVDGERGSRPRILSTEELLTEAVRLLFFFLLLNPMKIVFVSSVVLHAKR